MKKFLLILALVVLVIIIGANTRSNPVNTDNSDIVEQLIPSAPSEEQVSGKRVSGDYVRSNEETADGWILSNPASNGQQFSYPKTLGKYMSLKTDTLKVGLMATEGHVCNTKSKGSNGNATVIQKMINNKTYCVSTLKEGTLGHTYRSYDYTVTSGPGFYGYASFDISFTNCGVYGEDEEAVCIKEQAALNIDTMADRMIQSIRML